jgi:hypothetical protein
MIQRIQTVYLFLAILLIAALFYLPFAELTNTKGELYLLDAKGLYPVITQIAVPLFINTAVLILCAACIALMMITIFRYKTLKRQMSLAKISVLALLILAAVIFYEIYTSTHMLGGSYNIKIYAVFPIISLILVWLALRGMHKDDQLIKSIDRIR